jgi:hypothetical protein
MQERSRFVLLVEGHAEADVLGPFLTRWLESHVQHACEIETINCGGESPYRKRLAEFVADSLEPDVIGVFGVVDLYGLQFVYPETCLEVEQRVARARQLLMDRVADEHRPFFRQHFAVHEFEAWLLVDRMLLLAKRMPWAKSVVDALPDQPPEEINFDNPPSIRLNCLFVDKTGRTYGKRREAQEIVPLLDPSLVADKCPHFRAMVEDMKAMALAAFGEEQ